MIEQEWLFQQQKAFPFAPTPEQAAAMNTFAEFMTYGDDRSVVGKFVNGWKVY